MYLNSRGYHTWETMRVYCSFSKKEKPFNLPSRKSQTQWTVRLFPLSIGSNWIRRQSDNRLTTETLYFLPPANEVCEGYVFRGVCLSTGGTHIPSPRTRMSPGRYYQMRSMSGRYASYWNAFLLKPAFVVSVARLSLTRCMPFKA